MLHWTISGQIQHQKNVQRSLKLLKRIVHHRSRTLDFLLDPNAVSDLMEQHIEVRRHTVARIDAGDRLAICRPVYYEVLRGLFWKNATRQLRSFQRLILPLFRWVDLEDTDWEQAARFWADARRRGKQLGDPDLLLAALAYRLNATIVSADSDFDTLPVDREDWRIG